MQLASTRGRGKVLGQAGGQDVCANYSNWYLQSHFKYFAQTSCPLACPNTSPPPLVHTSTHNVEAFLESTAIAYCQNLVLFLDLGGIQ